MNFDQFKRMINETRTVSRVYHYSPYYADILKDGVLLSQKMLSSERRVVGGEDVIKKYGDKYISFARSITSSYIRIGNMANIVVFEFDRDALARNFKLMPVNWQYGTRHPSMEDEPTRRSIGVDEKEDRLITSQPGIPLPPYLIGVHIFSIGNEFSSDDQEQMEAHLQWLLKQKEMYDKAFADKKKLATVDKAVIDKMAFQRDKNLASIMQAERDLDNLKRNPVQYGIDERMFAKYPEVPFWVYTNKAAFKAGRWSEATQINPNVEGYEEDDDEEDV